MNKENFCGFARFGGSAAILTCFVLCIHGVCVCGGGIDQITKWIEEELKKPGSPDSFHGVSLEFGATLFLSSVSFPQE